MPRKLKDKPENLILGYLHHRKAISRHRAATHFDVWNLPLVIYKLKKRGHRFTHKGTGGNLTYTIIPEERSTNNQ